ncbi:MAG: hypothetical protein ACLFQB_00085 [Chitinispirillaceae bacterium]
MVTNEKEAAGGLTVLELIVIVAVSSIVFTLVLSSWNYLNTHVAHHENRALLRDETTRIADEIALKLRKTSGVLDMTYSSVRLLDRGDTLDYYFNGETLLKNGDPMALRGHQGGKITSFELEDVNETGSQQMLLRITLCSRDRENRSDTAKVLVQAKSLVNDRPDSEWGF